MAPLVEPTEGPELDRLITALLNATGAVHQLVGAEAAGCEDGLEIIDRVAGRLRSILVLFEEHHGDRELAAITEFLALATMVIAEQAGFEVIFHRDDPLEPRPPQPLE